jgi:dienelactone hydrolase
MVGDWQRTAGALATIGPPVAYVGFSMGAIFGALTVAAMPTIEAAVFVVGGIPDGGGIVDPALGPKLLEAAAHLGDEVDVLMINKTDDEVFPLDGVHAFFDAMPGERKRLDLWPGPHDEWPTEAIDASVEFLVRSLSRDHPGR